MATETTDHSLKAIAAKYAAELSLAKRHAKQLLELDPAARERVRQQIEEMVGAKPKE